MDEKTWLSIAAVVIFLLGFCGTNDKKEKGIKNGFYSSGGGGIYICTGPQSECYHNNRNCRGLKNCSAEIKEVTLEEAKSMYRRPCGYCY